MALLKLLKPDILVLGEDETLDPVVERDNVESYGGSVHIVKVASQVSTTTTIDNIVGRFR